MRNVWSSLLILAASTLFLAGCGQQALTQLKPKTVKKGVAIVYHSDATTVQTIHSMVQDQLHTSKNTFVDLAYTTATQTDQEYKKVMQSKQYQLVVTNASAPALQSVGNESVDTIQTAWIPDLATVLNDTYGTLPKPAVQVNTSDLAFMDGYLAGSISNSSKIGIVLPDLQGAHLQLAKWVQSGIHFAGYKGSVNVLDLSKSVQSSKSNSVLANSNSAIAKSNIDPIRLTSSAISQSDSQIFIFPVPVDDKVIQSAYGKSVILGFPSTSQFRGIIADTKPLFAESVQALLQAWNLGKWKPGQTLTIFPDTVVHVRNSMVVNSSIEEGIKALSASIANRSFSPKLDPAQP